MDKSEMAPRLPSGSFLGGFGAIVAGTWNGRGLLALPLFPRSLPGGERSAVAMVGVPACRRLPTDPFRGPEGGGEGRLSGSRAHSSPSPGTSARPRRSGRPSRAPGQGALPRRRDPAHSDTGGTRPAGLKSPRGHPSLVPEATLKTLSSDLFAHSRVGVLGIGPEGRVLLANPSAVRLLQGPREPLGTELFSWPRVAGSPLAQMVERALVSHEGATANELSVRSLEDPEPRFLDAEIVVPPGPAGSPALLLLVEEVTGRVTEHARAQLFYRAFLYASDAMEITDARGILVDVNPAFERIYGYRRDEVIGRKPAVVASGKTPLPLYETLWRDLLDPGKGSWQGEIINRSKDGAEHPVLLTVYALRDEDGNITHFMGLATDLTRRKRMQQRTAQMDRLTSLGQMAAGVAHEINTPLANITLVAESLRRKSSDPWVKARADVLLGQAEAASRIVRSLLEFSRPREAHVTDLDLNHVVREAMVFVTAKQSPEVELESTLSRAPLIIQGDRHQLIQVVVNLLSNAYDAVAGKGLIRIVTEAANGLAELRVVDSGPGIPAAVRSHLFEPFFTTKMEGKGTGLGLAICYGIVRSHGGEISARDAPGSGAEFVVRLPLAGAGKETGQLSPEAGVGPAA